ncbi:MAG: peptidoglycan DD-metalloendopeptidase family protein [Sneathiella sp.]|nr:peptidoglycan DD-metalloendopeptidase family protein [Sneathiella sp.]
MRSKIKHTANGKKSSYKYVIPLLTVTVGGVIGGTVAYSFLPDEDIASIDASESSNSSETDSANSSLKEVVTAPQEAAPTTPTIEEVTKTVSVGKGDTLMKLLTRSGATPQESHQAIVALSEKYDPRQLKIGQDIKLSFIKETPPEQSSPETVQLISVSLKEDVDRELAAIRKEDGFSIEETVISLEKEMARAEGVIENSLFLAASKAGLPTRVILDLIRIYSYDVDFQREIQTGDKFEVFFERFVDKDGNPLKEGNVQYAALTLSGEKIALYRYQTPDDKLVDYYSPLGQSVRKTLMRTPIDGARLTSGFGKRKHPILGYTKMHRGADFGAPRGTPIMAAGDGVIEMAGRNGAYGNYVRIRHTDSYKTAYAHMKGFAKGMRKGKRVKQGQTIGYVGTTGRSTGPHLHYEVLKNGRQINPLSVKLPAGRKLKGKILTSFKSFVKKMDIEVAAVPLLTEMAQLEAKNKTKID